MELGKQIDLASDNDWVIRFEKLTKALHYSCVMVACESSGASLADLALKTSISLLRFTDFIVADRCYYVAGVKARMADRHSEAFVFLNHFLDIEECVEDGPDGGAVLDVDDFRCTDFPLEIPLPPSLSLGSHDREKVREWVLTISVDQKVEQGLPVDQRGVYLGSLTSHASRAPTLQECVLTGSPVRGASIQFDSAKRVANRDDWNKLMSVARQSPQESQLNDVLGFIKEWCGVIPSYTF